MIQTVLAAQRPLGGAGLRILTESVNSPTLAAQIRALLQRLPSAKWHQWDALGRENVKRGARLAFGRAVETQYRLDRADVIVTLDADFLGAGPGGLRYARDFAGRRRPEDAGRMNRLYAIESMPTLTGSRADHRFPVQADGDRGHRAAPDRRRQRAVRQKLGRRRRRRPARRLRGSTPIAKDLHARRGSSLVVAGDGQPPVVHALVHGLNESARERRPDARLHRPDRGRSRRSGRVAQGSRRRHAGRARRGSRHRRRQPGLHGARRHPLRGRPRQGRAPHSPQPVRR